MRHLTDPAALILGGACLACAAAAQGGRASPALDGLNSFAPFWLAGGLLAAAYGAILARGRLRVALPIIGLVGALCAALSLAPELARPLSPPVAAGGERTLKLIAFNTWDRNRDIDGTADWIAAQTPDLVLVEEAIAPMRQAMIARGFHCTVGNGHVAIFSRAPPDREAVRVTMAEWPRLPPFARARFGPGPDGFSVFAVHLGRERDKIASRQVLAGLLRRYDRDRLIVAGDFNLTPWSFAMRRLDRNFGLERRDRAMLTWPAQLPIGATVVATLPFLPLDHVYAGAAWRTVSLTRGPSLGSDHFPVVAVLALRG